MKRYAALLGLVTVLAGCADGATGTDAAADARRQDGGTSCEQYCACATSVCDAGTTEAGSCIDQCATLSAEQRDCRANHCALVQAGTSSASAQCPYVLEQGRDCM